MFRASRHQSHSLENGRPGFYRNFSMDRRLGELRRMSPQASKKMLAQRLRENGKGWSVHSEGSELQSCCMRSIQCRILEVSLSST